MNGVNHALKKGVQVKEAACHILIEEERCENRRKENLGGSQETL